MRRILLHLILFGSWFALDTRSARSLADESPAEQIAEQPKSSPNQGNDILQTDAWRTIMHDFDEWASVQQIYDPEQIAKYRDQLIQKASSLKGNELQDFLDDLSAKLKILASEEARKARQWLAETLAVASDSYAKKVKAGLPDVSNLTASQLQEQLDEFQGRRAQTQASAAEFKRAREQQVASFQAERRRQEAAVAQADARAQSARAQSDSYSGYYPGSGGSRGRVRRYPVPVYSGRYGGLGWGGYWGGLGGYWGGWGGYRW